MDVRFDAVAADELINNMATYCSGIQKETRELLELLKQAGGWQDNQMRAFQSNITEIAHDLNKALALESEYMNTFNERINELRR